MRAAEQARYAIFALQHACAALRCGMRKGEDGGHVRASERAMPGAACRAEVHSAGARRGAARRCAQSVTARTLRGARIRLLFATHSTE